MSFPPGVPAVSIGGSLYTSVQPVRQPAMVVPVAPVRHVTLVPVSSVMMRPVMTNQTTAIRTISAPPQPMIQTMSYNPVPAAVISNPPQIQAGAKITHPVTIESGPKPPTGSHTPPVTVFVSNITDKASDTLVRQMLMKCGTVYGWKRVQGASGKLQAFGFCEYKDVEAALRAIYLLHDFKLGEKKLLVKVDAKTQDIINKWKQDNKIEQNEDGTDPPPPNAEESKSGIELLMKEYASELTSLNNEPEVPAAPTLGPKIDEQPVVRESNNVEENLKSLDLEDSEKDFISKEIRSFRAAQKLKEEEKMREKEEKKRREEREKRDEERDKEREKQREREREGREREKERERSSRKDVRSPRRSRTPRRREIHQNRTPPRPRRRTRSPPERLLNRTRSPPRRRSRSRSIHGSRPRRSRSRSLRRPDDETEDDEGYERRRLERKIREKEAAYQERLRTWETRERRRKRDYEKRDERDALIRKEMLREAKRLQEFLADYDDLKMDYKYYTSGAMMKRRREWEREQESDNRDRKKEQDEIEVLRQKLVQENHPDPDSAISKALKETEDVWHPLLKAETPPPPPDKPPLQQNDASSSSSSSSGSDSDSEREGKSGSNSSDSDDESGSENRARLVTANLVPVTDEPSKTVTVSTIKKETVSQNGNDTPEDFGVSGALSQQQAAEIKMEEQTTPYMISKPPQLANPKPEPVMQIPGANQRRKLKVSDVFNQDDDEEEVPKKRKLVPLEYTHEERNAIHPVRSAEDRRKMVRAMIEKIPTKKEDLFDFNLDWSMVDASLMEKRIQPWITKKIVEYIGEEEPTLVEFICSKIMSKSSPERIYEDISMVLDDEAEVFVVKMWRLLIYETEAKKEGLTK